MFNLQQGLINLLIVFILFVSVAILYVKNMLLGRPTYGALEQPLNGAGMDTDVPPIEMVNEMPEYTGNADFSKARIMNAVIPISDARKDGIITYYDPYFQAEKTFDTKSDFYLPPSSNKQIQQIIKYGSVTDKARLFVLLIKQTNNIYDFLKFSSMTDNSVYSMIKSKESKYKDNPIARGEEHAKQVYMFINRYVKNISTYLDYGCGDGYFTKYLAGMYNISKYDCVDIESTNNGPNYSVIKPTDTQLPYSDNTFDLITANMALHHVGPINEISREIVRILSPGGFLFIKEHNCWNAFDAMLIDIEHALYMHSNEDYGHAVHFKNYFGWQDMFKSLKLIGAGYYMNNDKYEITPTVAYWNVFTKEQ